MLLMRKSILLKYPYDQKQSDSMQSLSKFQWNISRSRTNNSKNLYRNTKYPNSSSNHEKEQSWKYHILQFQTILRSYSNQNSVVLA